MPPPNRDVTLVKIDNPFLAEGHEREVVLPRLHIVIERERGADRTTTRIFDGEVCRIGSHVSNDLVLEDPTISRFHCRIQRESDKWHLVDTGSTNGTRLNGVKVLSAEIEGEAVVSIGDSSLRIRPGGHGEVLLVPQHSSFGSLVGNTESMQRLFAMLERVAASDIDVLVNGESGTGKELVASEIVQRSSRAEGPLVVVDCGSISPNLVESELFGHVRGAFTGAERDREGAFEAADGGTVFLDEIGELPLELQPKLLRALEQREVRRVGQTKAKRVDVRVIAATHRDLEREVNRGRFREDLYYRLAKVRVDVPPLRDRLEDLPFLVKTFLTNIDPSGKAQNLFSPQVYAELALHDWPGNVRELRNYVERCVVLDDTPPPSKRSGTMPAFRNDGTQPAVDPEQAARRQSLSYLTPSAPFRVAKEEAVAAFERAYIGPLLERCQGNMSKAARTARMDRMYLHQLAQKHGFRTSKKDSS